MIAGVGAGVGFLVNWNGVMSTGLVRGLSGIWVAGTMVTIGGNAGWVSFGTLGEGAGKSVWSVPAGEGRGAFGAVGGLAVMLEKMRESVWMEDNWLLPSVENGVGFGCKRASASVRAAALAALGQLPEGTGQSWGRNSTVLAMRSARVHGM